MTVPLDQLVAAFNHLGYSATFSQVAEKVGLESPTALYRLYPSREALGEAWLSTKVPPAPNKPGLHNMFSTVMLSVLADLESQRDFSRAWLAAMVRSGPLRLPELSDFHDQMHDLFHGWLEANHRTISLPDEVSMEDVGSELADALCAVALWLVGVWETDRRAHYAYTRTLLDSTAYLLDALLVRRSDFGEAGLLLHLHRVLDQTHRQLLQPLLNIVLKPERAQRFADPVNLVEMLRTLRPPSGHQT